MSTSSYHHGNLRSALIEAGLSAIADDPRGALSVRDLARRAGVSPSAAYRHFADKDALLAALAAEGFRLLATSGVDVARQATPSERLVAYGRGYVDFARANPALFRLMFGGTLSRATSDELASDGGQAFSMLRAGIAAAGALPFDDPRVTVGTAFAWAVVHGLASLILDDQLQRLGIDLDRLVDDVLQIAAKR